MAQSGLAPWSGPSQGGLRNEAGWLLRLLLTSVALWLAGCATSDAEGRRYILRDTRGASGGLHDAGGGGGGFWKRGDDFQRLQEAAGLEEEDWHEAGEELESGDARALWEALVRTKTTLRNFAPRRSLFFLLGQVSAQRAGLIQSPGLQGTEGE